MTPSAALAEHYDEVRKLLNRFGLRNPRVFGSAARGSNGENSDLDILIDAPPGTTLFDLAAAELQLQALLGCRVEVLTEGFMAPDVLARAQRDFTKIV